MGSRGHPWVSPVRAATKALPLETRRGPQNPGGSGMGVKAQNRAVGPPRSPTRAPLVGVGADVKTTLFWGGRSSPPGPSAYAARWLK
ncbi:MAG: hypothetical protein L7G96_04410 [Vulcanisaeta sp.]|nr:hypothetical protein [Vulcanisaeta sp.]